MLKYAFPLPQQFYFQKPSPEKYWPVCKKLIYTTILIAWLVIAKPQGVGEFINVHQ